MNALPLITHKVSSSERNQIIDLTPARRQLIRQHKLTQGMAIIYVPHTTAALETNENADPDVKHDLLEKLAALIPNNESYYTHSEGNSDSHEKTDRKSTRLNSSHIPLSR